MLSRIQFPGTVRAQERTRRQRVVVEMGEAPIQPGLVTAAVGVRHEPGGLIAPRGQVLGQGGARGIESELPLGIELERPLAGEEAGVRGKRPWGGRQRELVRDALLCPPCQVGSGVAANSRRGSGCRRGRCPRRSTRRCERVGAKAVIRPPSGIHEPPANPTSRTARTPSTPRSAAKIDRV